MYALFFVGSASLITSYRQPGADICLLSVRSNPSVTATSMWLESPHKTHCGHKDLSIHFRWESMRDLAIYEYGAWPLGKRQRWHSFEAKRAPFRPLFSSSLFDVRRAGKSPTTKESRMAYWKWEFAQRVINLLCVRSSEFLSFVIEFQFLFSFCSPKYWNF